jgi:hypothetical protein
MIPSEATFLPIVLFSVDWVDLDDSSYSEIANNIFLRLKFLQCSEGYGYGS